MKKIFYCSLLLLIITLASCAARGTNETTTVPATSNQAYSNITLEATSILHVGDKPYGYTKHVHYYYQVFDSFRDLVGGYEYSVWIGQEKPVFDDANEMAIVQFIKHFEISKEQFDEANAKLSEDMGEESPYNANIIYTFDNELISEYYSIDNFVIDDPDWR